MPASRWRNHSVLPPGSSTQASTSLGLLSGQDTVTMNSALAGMSPALRALGLNERMAMTNRKTKAINMLNNMS